MSITLKKVSYSYQGKYQTVRAVDDVSYDFEPGKVYAIVGKSGSGKTTLLSLMAGLDLPVEGDIIVDGRSTREWDRSRMRRDAVSVIYQNYNLFPLLTVQENIQYPLSLKKLPKKEALALAREVRARVELPDHYDKRLPKHLSGGEQQRVAIARSLAQGCKIILADEVSPDTCRLWDANTKEKLDKDRFRRDLGGVEEAYQEVWRRIKE